MRLAIGLTLAAAMLIAGCSRPLEEVYVGDARYGASVGMQTAQNRALRAIPAPRERITVAVYDMPDLTGQYKEDEQTQNLSRAVTQGGAAILIKALQDAGERRWFTVLDRSNLDNLLRERQIITEMRRVYRNETQIDPSVLGPLQHSGILIEGAIIGYDSSIVSGGLGARYLGIGGDRRWKLDVVTINLRAVSTETSEVLASVVVRKPIASTSNRGSVFTYVALDELVEAETGVAMNEPKQIAIEQAVEKGVMALIAEGAMLGLWGFSEQAEGSAFVSNYVAQKFDGQVPVEARRVAAPATRNAARIPTTVPARAIPVRAQVTERRMLPAVRAPAPAPVETPRTPPNEPGSPETVG